MTKYKISGMSCAACSARIKKTVEDLEGVEECSVNLLTNSMTVKGNVLAYTVTKAIFDIGYGAELDGGKVKKGNIQQHKAESEAKSILIRLGVSLVFLAALMYISMGHVMWGAPLPSALSSSPMAIALAELFLSGAVLIINRRFFISGIKGALHKAANMDTLVALGSGASFGYSVYLVFLMSFSKENAHELLHSLYFESAAMILTLITIGKLLEEYSKGKTTSALKKLISLSPRHAVLLRDNQEVKVPVDEVKKGDIFIVKAGESVAVDAIITEGSAALDDSSLTGESIPCDKEAGDKVYASSINLNGYLVCKATEVGEDTALSKIIQAVSDASAEKAPIARLADRVSGVFVPFVITIALITAVIWLLLGGGLGFGLKRAISVLVISCPCALGLATPVAVMVANGKGAREGILFKTALSLEETGKIKTVAIDKTGTLTLGKPEITDILASKDTDRERLLMLAFSIEKKSEHPLAKAIVSYAEENKIPSQPCTELEIISGSGIKAKVKDKTIAGGSLKFIRSMLELSAEAEKLADKLACEGKTPLFFAEEGTLLGIIAVADKLKPDSKEAVEKLQRMGISVIMLTGDNEKTAKAVAQKIGIKNVIAGLLPHEKENAVKMLKSNGKVLMVGDGINDAPSLASADIGIAIGTGAEIARDSADIVLMHSSPLDIAAAIKLSKAAMRNIRQNLFWAFFYNAIGIPLAAGAFIHLLSWELNPMFGAAAMSLSSFFVVTNALRLNHVKLNGKPKKAKERKEKEMTVTLYIKGMMCPHCENAVKTALEEIDGVSCAVADHKKGTAAVTLSKAVDTKILTDTVTKKGYSVTDVK